MIIKSLTLHDFRQFRGTQSIEFSTDPDRKTTLVIAENTTGKTTILESFRWIFYGSTDLKTIINNDQNDEMQPNSQSTIWGEVVLEHLGIEYHIKRNGLVIKNAVNAKVVDTELIIHYIDTNGIEQELRGDDAQQKVLEIVPRDLFPYFFFQGENIEKIGHAISNGRNTDSSEFVKAIRGMLGFNWLYKEKEHLLSAERKYRKAIEENQNDTKLQDIQKRINTEIDNIQKDKKELNEIEKNLEAYTRERDELNALISHSAAVAEKQTQSLELQDEIANKTAELRKLQDSIFKKFSSNGMRYLSKSLFQQAEKLLQDNDDIDKGIPGMDATAIEYLLQQKKCICGLELKEDCPEFVALKKAEKYLPPNNLGAEISSFLTYGKQFVSYGDEFKADFDDRRGQLTRLQAEIDEKSDKKDKLDQEIQNAPDISKKKQRQIELDRIIANENVRIGAVNTQIEDAQSALTSANKEKENYKVLDENSIKLQECDWQVSTLINRIENYCKKKEAEKKAELESAINDIFFRVFNSDLAIELDNNYHMRFIQKKSDKEKEDISEAFETSGAQDAIMAFSFIGGIIELAKKKAAKKASDNSDDLDDDYELEPYPLVMDAPSSSFDKKRIKSFCVFIPNIAEQLIFFIKDTDGLVVKENLKGKIGKEYSIQKSGKFESKIVPGSKIEGVH